MTNPNTISAVVPVISTQNTNIIKVSSNANTTSINGFTYSPTGAASWPFRYLTQPICSNMTNPAINSSTCTKWPIINNGDWDKENTWNNNSVPGRMDIVCIPAGITVNVKKSPYNDNGTTCDIFKANPPRMFVFVCGTLNFMSPGKLYLGCNSTIQIYPNGKINPDNSASEIIKIGTIELWGG